MGRALHRVDRSR